MFFDMDCRVRHLKFKANTIEGIYPHLILADTQNLFQSEGADYALHTDLSPLDFKMFRQAL